jgi:hypothetical protein
MQTKLNVQTFNFNQLFAWRRAGQKIVIPLSGIKTNFQRKITQGFQERHFRRYYFKVYREAIAVFARTGRSGKR